MSPSCAATCSGSRSPRRASTTSTRSAFSTTHPTPAQAFLGLARLLKPGGRIAIWVYPASDGLAGMDHERPARRFDTLAARSARAPLPRGRPRSAASSARLMASRWRLVAAARRRCFTCATIGVSMHPDPEVRVCDTLDWYAPRFLSRHTFDEIAGWFREAGLTDVVDLAQRPDSLPRRPGKRHQHRRPRPTGGVPASFAPEPVHRGTHGSG